MSVHHCYNVGVVVNVGHGVVGIVVVGSGVVVGAVVVSYFVTNAIYLHFLYVISFLLYLQSKKNSELNKFSHYLNFY